jgi:hypothetical protein
MDLYLLVSTITEYLAKMPEVVRMIYLHVVDGHHVGDNQQSYEDDNVAHSSVSAFLGRVLPAHIH